MSYRPEGWDFAHQKVSDKIPFFNPKSLCDGTTYEAGADAMLEKLREVGVGHIDKDYYLRFPDKVWQPLKSGTLVFIPDD